MMIEIGNWSRSNSFPPLIEIGNWDSPWDNAWWEILNHVRLEINAKRYSLINNMFFCDYGHRDAVSGICIGNNENRNEQIWLLNDIDPKTFNYKLTVMATSEEFAELFFTIASITM